MNPYQTPRGTPEPTTIVTTIISWLFKKQPCKTNEHEPDYENGWARFSWKWKCKKCGKTIIITD